MPSRPFPDFDARARPWRIALIYLVLATHAMHSHGQETSTDPYYQPCIAVADSAARKAAGRWHMVPVELVDRCARHLSPTTVDVDPVDVWYVRDPMAVYAPDRVRPWLAT
ncbi:hypothetical protein PTE30175_04661 [Pandoraea terrae]|uniref:Uncharacterized protein n=1 Tax=Pandoraea terrae TaxID=1537710 RepID=A0A5E4YUM5_9BURK|nr:hypothetical protein [Pandoraea terrae]VVE52157.1 hypothetical protein PTE30175_04661 [Pandoraea terrae]